MANAKGIKILVAEDDEDLRETIATLFALFGFSVSTAINGEEAWQAIESEPFDIVISDIRMPKCDGVELLHRIRDRDRINPKVLFLTGYADYKIEDLYDYGVNGFFNKPFNSNSVRDSVQTTLLRRQDRWAQKPKEAPSSHIARRYKDLGEMVRANDIQIGRGGIYFGMKFERPTTDDVISFNIEIEDRIPCSNFSGNAVVKWVRTDEDGAYPPGIGAEIVYINNSSMEGFISTLDKMNALPYIPSGKNKK